MRIIPFAALLLALPTLAMAQNQTPLVGPDTPRDPARPGSVRPPPNKPDQTTLPNQANTQRSKDPFEPRADQTPAQRALPERAPAP